MASPASLALPETAAAPAPQPAGLERLQVGGMQWLFACLSVAVALLSALAKDAESVRLFLWPLATLSALLLATCWQDLSRGRIGKPLLFAAVLTFYWTEALGDGYSAIPFCAPASFVYVIGPFDVHYVSKALIYVALFQLALLGGYVIQPNLNGVIAIIRRRVDRQGGFARSLDVFFGVCSFVPVLLMTGFNLALVGQILLASRAGGSFELQEIGLVSYVGYFGMFGAAMCLLRAAQTKEGRWRSVAIGLLAFIPIFASGTRHLLLFPALPVILYFALKLRGRLNLRRLVPLVALALIIVTAARVQYAYRSTGFTADPSLDEERTSELLSTSTTGQFQSLLVALAYVPEHEDYFQEPATPYFFTHYIPHAWFENKPYMKSYEAYNAAFTGGSATWNATPSVIGQYHINWGILGVVMIGLWLGFLAGTLDRIAGALDLEKQRGVLVLLGMLYAFVASSFRIYHPLYLAYPLFGFFAMVVATRWMSNADQAQPGVMPISSR